MASALLDFEAIVRPSLVSEGLALRDGQLEVRERDMGIGAAM